MNIRLKRRAASFLAFLLIFTVNINPLAIITTAFCDSELAKDLKVAGNNIFYLLGVGLESVKADNSFSLTPNTETGGYTGTISYGDIIALLTDTSGNSITDVLSKVEEGSDEAAQLNQLIASALYTGDITVTQDEFGNNHWVADGESLTDIVNTFSSTTKEQLDKTNDELADVNNQLDHISDQLDDINQNIDDMQHAYKVGYVYSMNKANPNSKWNPSWEELPYLEQLVFSNCHYASIYSGFWNYVSGSNLTDIPVKTENGSTAVDSEKVEEDKDYGSHSIDKSVVTSISATYNSDNLSKNTADVSTALEVLGYDAVLRDEFYQAGQYMEFRIPESGVTYADVVEVIYKAMNQYCYKYVIETRPDPSITPAESPLSQSLSNIDKGFDTSEGKCNVWVTRSVSQQYWERALEDGLVKNSNRDKVITGKECLELIQSIMELYGEEVLSDDETDKLLQIYGIEYPIQLGPEVADAWAYLRVRGILNFDVDFTGTVDAKELFDIAYRIKDKSQRTDYKTIQVTMDLSDSMLSAGFYPVEDLSFDTGSFSVTSEIDYTKSDYYDYYIQIDKDKEVNGIKAALLRAADGAIIQSNLSVALDESEKGLGTPAIEAVPITGNDGKATVFYHVRVPIKVEKPFTITTTASLSDDSAKSIQVPTGTHGGIYYNFDTSASKDGVLVVDNTTGKFKYFSEEPYKSMDVFTTSVDGIRKGVDDVSTVASLPNGRMTVLESIAYGWNWLTTSMEVNAATASADDTGKKVTINASDTDKCKESLDSYTESYVLATLTSLGSSEKIMSIAKNMAEDGIDNDVVESFAKLIQNDYAYMLSADSYDNASELSCLPGLSSTTSLNVQSRKISDYQSLLNALFAGQIVQIKIDNKYYQVFIGSVNGVQNGKVESQDGESAYAIQYKENCLEEVTGEWRVKLPGSNEYFESDSPILLGTFLSNYLSELDSSMTVDKQIQLIKKVSEVLLYLSLDDCDVKFTSAPGTLNVGDNGDFNSICVVLGEIFNLTDSEGNAVSSEDPNIAQDIAKSAIMNKQENILISWSDLIKCGIVEDTFNGKQPEPKEGVYYLQVKDRGIVKVNNTAHTILIGTTFYNLSYENEQEYGGPTLVYIDEETGETFFDFRCVMGLSHWYPDTSQEGTVVQKEDSVGAGKSVIYSLNTKGISSNVMSTSEVNMYNWPDIGGTSSSAISTSYKMDVIRTTQYDNKSWSYGENGDTVTYYPAGEEHNYVRIPLASFCPTANWMTVITNAQVVDDTLGELSYSDNVSVALYVWYPKQAFEELNKDADKVKQATCKDDASTAFSEAFVSSIETYQTPLSTYVQAANLGSEWYDVMTKEAAAYLYMETRGGVALSEDYVIRRFDVSKNTAAYGYNYYEDRNKLEVKQYGYGNQVGAIYWLDGIGYVYNAPVYKAGDNPDWNTDGSAIELNGYNHEAYLEGKLALPIAVATDTSKIVTSFQTAYNFNVDVYDGIKDSSGKSIKDANGNTIDSRYGIAIGPKGVYDVFNIDFEDSGGNCLAKLSDLYGYSDTSNYKYPYDITTVTLAPAGYYTLFAGDLQEYITPKELTAYRTTIDKVFMGGQRLQTDESSDASTVKFKRIDTNLPSFEIAEDDLRFYRVYDTKTSDIYVATKGNFVKQSGGQVSAVNISDLYADNAYESEFSLDYLLDKIDEHVSFIILLAFYAMPILGIILTTVLAALIVMSDIRLVQILADKFFDPVKLLTGGRKDIHNCRDNGIVYALVPCLVLWCAFALILNGNLIRIVQWCITWYAMIKDYLMSRF